MIKNQRGMQPCVWFRQQRALRQGAVIPVGPTSWSDGAAAAKRSLSQRVSLRQGCGLWLEITNPRL